MLVILKDWKPVTKLKKYLSERRRIKDLKEVEKQEKLWDMKLRGLR